MHTSLDGYVADRYGGTDWMIMDDELLQNIQDFTTIADAVLFGRTTYQLMESRWTQVLTDPQSTPVQLHHAGWLEQIHKMVFSGTLTGARWNNTMLVKDHFQDVIGMLKQLPGRHMILYGSPQLTQLFAAHGLIDEFRTYVHPVQLGEGRSLSGDHASCLQLQEEQTMRSGVMVRHWVAGAVPMAIPS